MIKDINYTEETTYTGRNGQGKQVGLGFTHNGSCLLLEPINSKGHLANCQMNIPYKDMITVIETLQQAYIIHGK